MNNILISLLFSAVLLTGSPLPAWAGEPSHDWIMKGQYDNGRGQHCCGPEHCRPVSSEQIRRTTAGAVVSWTDGQGQSHVTEVPRAAIRPSQDGVEWFCTMGCLFILPEA